MAVVNDPPKLFGAYITNLSLSLSWGSQGASAQVTIVEDPDNGVIADIPAPGTPVIFPGEEETFGPFNYNKPLVSGFLQRWSYDESLSGRTFNVVIASPAIIFDGIQVILGEFDGHASGGLLTNEVSNLLNVYAHYENFLVGGNYGQLGQGGFGDSAVDDLGFPIFGINEDGEQVDLFGTLVNMTYDPTYSNFGDPIRNGDWEYQLDFTELYNVIVAKNIGYYRIGGNVRDLSGMISEICDLVQYDWIVELLPDPEEIRPILKLRLIDRSITPTAGVISSYLVDARKNPGSTSFGKIVSVSYGQELTKATTAKVVMGGPVSRYVDRHLDLSTPLWGRGDGELGWQMHPPIGGKFPTSTGVYTRNKLMDPEYSFPLSVPGYGVYNATLMEMRILGAKRPDEVWGNFKVFQMAANVEPNGWQLCDLPDLPFYSTIQIEEQLISRVSKRQIPIQQLQQTRGKQNRKRQLSRNQQEFDVFFDALSEIAKNSFCRQFMVRLPMDLEEFYPGLIGASQLIRENIRFINTYGDLNAEQYERSWNIVSDAWALDPQVGRADFFNDGRLKAMVGFKKAALNNDWGGEIPRETNAFEQQPPPQPFGREVYTNFMGENWTITSPRSGGGNNTPCLLYTSDAADE